MPPTTPPRPPLLFLLPPLLHPLLVLLLLLAPACAGETSNPAGDGRTIYNESGIPHDGTLRPDKDPTIQPDKGPSDPCAVFAKAGQTCAGGQSCPSGLQPATLGSTPCTCYVSCNPDASKFCSPLGCNRICVQLYDSSQQPMKGVGVCVDDPGKAEGEPCAPAVCRQGLVCTLHGSTVSFCRRSCKDQSGCPAFKMVCVALTSSTQKVCVPGGSTTGPKEGQPCADPSAYCVSDLICDPQSKVCLKACDPSSSACATGKTCTQLVDKAVTITVGYGCK